RLCRGFGGRYRRQFRGHRRRPHRRGAGHGGEDPVHRGAAARAAGAGEEGHRQARRPAETGGDVSARAASLHEEAAGRHRRLTGRVVVATHNAGKLREMRELLAGYGIEAVSAGELGLAEPSETGQSFAENARIKAGAAADASGLPALADDSGLAVDALGGAPGIHSARWAGAGRDFAAAMRKVEDALRAAGAAEPPRRRAHFVSALCVAWPD